MNSKSFLLILSLFLLSQIHEITAQRTAVFTEPNQLFVQGKEFYDQGMYGRAQLEFEKVIQMVKPANEPTFERLLLQSELYRAKAAVRQGLPEGQRLIEDFVKRYAPDPASNDAIIEMANYFFEDKEYDRAIEYFAMVPTYQMTSEQRSEVRFKMGYSYFVKKKFNEAKTSFNQIRNIPGSKYYLDANYYHGLCDFYGGNYDQAIKALKIAEKDRRYNKQIPFFVSQIYFAQGKYDDLISYATPMLNETGISKQKELNQLVGQAWFEKKDFAKALPYLEYYAERSGRLTEEEFFQLGYTQYMTKNYPSAIKNFEQLGSSNNQMGQLAMYYLGDSYVKTNNRTAARTSFATASSLNFDAEIREEATFQYGKLSAELKYDAEAISTLSSISTKSIHYNEAQNLLADLFKNTKDYATALELLDKMPEKTPQLKEAYQKVAFNRGLQLYKDRRNSEAELMFKKSLNFPVDANLKALATFWLGEMANEAGNTAESKRYIDQFLVLAKNAKNLPDESSLATANYIQGYNLLKEKNYSVAAGYFQEAVAAIRRNQSSIVSNYIKSDILGDATLRTADCYLIQNKYKDASRFYDEAIRARYNGHEYALFQKAIIMGLEKSWEAQSTLLDQIIREYPNSEYADDALLEQASIYMNRGNNNNARAPLQKLINNYQGKSPLINDAYFRMGLIDFQGGNYLTAAEWFKRIMTNNPSGDMAKSTLEALEQLYVKELGREQDYISYVETLPGYKIDATQKDELTYKAAKSQYDNGNYDRAVDGFTNYIRSYPSGINVLDAYANRGDAFFNLEKYTESRQDYEFIIRRGNSQYLPVALERAADIAYNINKDFPAAYDLFSKFEPLATSDALRLKAQLFALRAAARSNNPTGVRQMAAKVKSNPAATSEDIATASYSNGLLAYESKDYATAKASFNEVVKNVNNQESVESYYYLAEILYKERNLKAAGDAADLAASKANGYPNWVAKSIILAADINVEQGNLIGAKAALEAVVNKIRPEKEILDEAKEKLASVESQLNRTNNLGGTGSKNLEMDEGN